MKINNIYISYYINNELKEISLNFIEDIENNDLKIISSIVKLGNGYILEIKLKNKKPIMLNEFFIDYKINLKNKNMFVNGYQSWSESMEMSLNDELKNLNPMIRSLRNPYGDYDIFTYSMSKGKFHSNTFTYFKDCKKNNKSIFFLGSLDETSGYTAFHGDLKCHKLIIKKDCSNFLLNKERSIIKIYIEEGEIDTIWNNYLSFFNRKEEIAPMCIGWESEYIYHNLISEDIILENLENLKKENIPIDIFQVDDGYETHLGDWITINNKFPLGMNFLAYKIKSYGYKPGIFIAPFICEKESLVFKKHKDWLVKHKNGKLLVGGWKKDWKGKFYVLDFYNIQVRRYLSKIFHIILNIWGYEVIKLDYLYVNSIIPRYKKTRGEIMKDVIDFLCDIVGDKWIIASGVPLQSVFNKVDYCSVARGITPFWENNKEKFLRYRERKSTFVCLHNLLSRFRLNGKAFNNASASFMLRCKNNKLNYEQKYTLFILSNLLGGMVSFSDNIGEYNEKTKELFKSMFPKVKANIKYIKNKNNVYKIFFNVNEKEYIVICNLRPVKEKVKLPKGEYFNKDDNIVFGNENIKLKAYESKCFYKIKKDKEGYFIGTTGHLFPGCEIEKIEVNKQFIDIKIKDNFINKDNIFLKLRNDNIKVLLNGKICELISEKDHKLIKF